MKTKLVLQFAILLVTLLAGPTEEFFFEYPRKALTAFFQSLRAKTQPPKTNVQHYHVHYYPLPLTPLGWTKAPDKWELDKLYEDSLVSFGWSDYRYKFLPEPSIIVSSGLQQLEENADSWKVETSAGSGSDEVRATIDRNAKGILVRVPINQHFVLQLKKGRQKEAAA